MTLGVHLSGDETVSMNFWGLRPSIFPALERRLVDFMDAGGVGELYLPAAIDSMIDSGEASVTVLPSDESRFGITYAADVERVRARITAMVAMGTYPANLHLRQ